MSSLGHEITNRLFDYEKDRHFIGDYTGWLLPGPIAELRILEYIPGAFGRPS